MNSRTRHWLFGRCALSINYAVAATCLGRSRVLSRLNHRLHALPPTSCTAFMAYDALIISIVHVHPRFETVYTVMISLPNFQPQLTSTSDR